MEIGERRESMISVIMPCYNADHYIRQALDSVAGQSYSDWECVCTDDGSTDETGRILDLYAERDGRFRIIHQKNQGEGAARNSALAASRGEWIVFLDADDILNKNLLSVVVSQITKHPTAELITYKCASFKEHDQMAFPDCILREHIEVCSERLSPQILSMGVFCGAYKRDLLNDLKFSRLKIGADLVFVSQCLSKVNYAVLLDFVGLGYRVVANSMAHRERTPDMMIDTIDMRIKMLQSFLVSKKQLPKPYIRMQINRCVEGIGSELLEKPTNEEWSNVWEHWVSVLRELLTYGVLSRWQSLVVWIVATTKSRMAVQLFCYVPYALKRMGLHR